MPVVHQFAHDSNDWLARSVTGNKRRQDISYTAFNATPLTTRFSVLHERVS